MLRSSRIALIHGTLVVFAAAIVVRAAVVQLWQGGQWRGRAERQHFASTRIPAPRGDIADARGVPLARSREMVRLAVAPRELRSPAALARSLAGLGVPRPWIARATDTRRVWVALPGLYPPADAAPVTAMRGVYTDAATERFYTAREAIRRITGWVDADDRPVGGIELALDSLLRGRDGRVTLSRDAHGRRFLSPGDSDVAAVRGDAVELTISQTLQEIAAQALADAVTRTRASGGDIVILDPRTGEIRAMASQRIGSAAFGNTAISEPFEPGSTLKPLFVSQLLMRHLARPTDVVNTEHGVYRLDGRTITDVHRTAQLSLTDVIRYSSNIGIVKFVSRMTQRQEFETLRDFGFGTPTGVVIPGEASGMLRAPVEWSKQSPASLAMGYEVSVTPLQLATAYAAIANGGTLMAPAVVREIRSPDGSVLYHHEPVVVRRLMTPEVAAEVRSMMVGVVEGGTGREAAMGRFVLAGKSGTARRTGRHGRYVAGAYTASFVGLFPAQDPQYVIFVKLDDPQSTIYGGTAAAPVSKIVLQAALAARDAALDRRELAARESLSTVTDSSAAQLSAATVDTAHLAPDDGTVPVTLDLPLSRAKAPPAALRAVPDVHGMPLRSAVRALHAAGFRVLPAGWGAAASTSPAAGSLLRAGTLVRLATAP